jgi:formamidopyrimidine-DNA glycosylase
VPELPELQALAEGLGRALAGSRVAAVRAWQPATVKTVAPALEDIAGRQVAAVWRRGKLIGVAAGGLTLVLHLMGAGRLGLLPATGGGRPSRQAALDLVLEDGRVLRMRELSTERRASAHLLRDEDVPAHPPLARLGPEPLGLDAEGWRAALGAAPGRLHTALRDGRRVAGIGRAYADEIMWAARLAPYAPVDRLGPEGWERLAAGAGAVLGQALARARERIDTELPTREARVLAVHGHHGEPCLRCTTRLERVSFEGYELVYCPRCQTGGRVYADRRRSRFLR